MSGEIELYGGNSVRMDRASGKRLATVRRGQVIAAATARAQEELAHYVAGVRLHNGHNLAQQAIQNGTSLTSLASAASGSDVGAQIRNGQIVDTYYLCAGQLLYGYMNR